MDAWFKFTIENISVMKFSFRHPGEVAAPILWIVFILVIAGCNSGSQNKIWSFVKVKSNTETRLTKDYVNYVNANSSTKFQLNSAELNPRLPSDSSFLAQIGKKPDLSYFPTTLWQVYALNNKDDWKQIAGSYSHVFERDSFKIFNSGANIQNLLLTPYLISGSHIYYTTMMTALNNYLANMGNELERNKIAGIENAFPISKMLENQLLFFAFNQTGDPLYKNQAMKNSEIIVKRYFRYFKNPKFQLDSCRFYPDSCRLTRNKQIAYSDLAIGLYGFSYVYHETGIEGYHFLSRNIASLFTSILTGNPDNPSGIWNPDKPKLDLVTQSIVCLAFLNMNNQADTEFRKNSEIIYNQILETIENDDPIVEESASFKLFYYLLEYERQKQCGEMVAKR